MLAGQRSFKDDHWHVVESILKEVNIRHKSIIFFFFHSKSVKLGYDRVIYVLQCYI